MISGRTKGIKIKALTFRRRFLVCIILAAVGLTLSTSDGFSANGQQSVYYVATYGNDSNGNGSSTSPWASVNHALANVSDGSLILVRPGTYNGRHRLIGDFAEGVTLRAEIPYQARLRNEDTVVTCFYGRSLTLEGFDIAHSGPGAGPLVIHIQDLRGDPGGSDFVSRITIRNNVIHDSHNNDLLKINNGAAQVTVEGNVFYNFERAQ